MKKIIVLILLIVGCCIGELLAQCKYNIPAKIPGTYVQDHVQKLSPQGRQLVGEKVHNYKVATGIEIGVALIESVGDIEAHEYATEMFNCYGIGEKGVDNGVLLFISFDHKWQIVTGYRTDNYLTDLQCKEIGETYLVPNLRAGNVDQAVLQSLDAIISTLGMTPWPEREAARIKHQQELKEKAINVMEIIGGILLFLLTCFLCWRIYRRDKLRKALRADMLRMEQAAVWPTVEQKNWPSWAVKEYTDAKKGFDEKLPTFTNHIGDVNQLINENKLTKASELFNGDLSTSMNGLLNLAGIATSMGEKITKYKTDAPKDAGKLKSSVQSFISKVEGYIQKGFRFADTLGKTKTHLGEVDTLLNDLQHPRAETYRAVVETAAEITTKIKALEEKIDRTVQIHEEINQEASQTSDKITLLKTASTEAMKQLTTLQKICPDAVHSGLSKELSKTSDFLDSAKQNLATAIASNDLKTQMFDEAFTAWEKTLGLITSVYKVCESVKNVLAKQTEAKNSYSSNLQNARSAIAKARGKCSDSDVESTAKSYLSDAESYLRKAENGVNNGMADWVAVNTLLDKAKDKAEDAYRKAVRDIEEAENERENVRLAAIAAASRRDDNDSGSSSTSFNFGGGRSGGGGAGGTW